MKIYLIPGIGYTPRIFERLDFKNYQVTRLNWIEPKKNEAINDYAQRMLKDVLEEKEKVVLIGHSMGGIMAQEIASLKKIDKIILVSSIKSRKENPWYFKIVAPLGIHHLFTKELCIKTVDYWGKGHGFTEKGDLDLFKDMLSKQSNQYLSWVLKSLSKWKEPTLTKGTSIFHIHGTNDKTLPFKLIKNPDKVIEDGSHIMVYKKAKIIQDILVKEINKI